MHKAFMFLINPFRKFAQLYLQILSLSSASKTFFFIFSGLALGWWLYVPVHELLHAAGCLVGGGEVHRLEIKPLYGGAVLSRFFSFVIPASDYAGRLSGFDTHGSDLTYGLLIFFPFILSLFGFLGLEMATRKRAPFIFAFFLPCTFAPIISLTGDFFELGSLLLFQICPGSSEINRLLISDDIFRLLEDIGSGMLDITFTSSTLSFIGLSFLMGTALAWATIILSYAFRALVVRHIKE